jgi:hypothetical protein
VTVKAVEIGDLVIHVPNDGSRGSGPYYVDHFDTSRVQVSTFTDQLGYGGFLLPRDEVEVVGHYEVDNSDRFGYSFSFIVLQSMKSVIEAAKVRFYQRFPTFPDGTSEVLLSRMTHRTGFIANSNLTRLTNLNGEIAGVIPDQLVYAIPAVDVQLQVEKTAVRGKFILYTPQDIAYYVMFESNK